MRTRFDPAFVAAYLRACQDRPADHNELGLHYAEVAFQAARDALDPRQLRTMLQTLQAGEMSVGRAIELLEMWLDGKFSNAEVPPPPEDSALITHDRFPMELVRELRVEVARLQAAAPAPLPLATSAWHKTSAELEAIYTEMRGINETTAKELTAHQVARLKVLRAECVAVHEQRIALNTQALANVPAGGGPVASGRATAAIDNWLHVPTLKLRGGEMSAQEVRTVTAVLSALKAELAEPEREPAGKPHGAAAA